MKSIGVGLVAPALPNEDQARALEIGEWVGDELRVARIGQFRHEVRDQIGVSEDLAQQHHTGVAEEVFGRTSTERLLFKVVVKSDAVSPWRGSGLDVDRSKDPNSTNERRINCINLNHPQIRRH